MNDPQITEPSQTVTPPIIRKVDRFVSFDGACYMFQSPFGPVAIIAPADDDRAAQWVMGKAQLFPDSPAQRVAICPPNETAVKFWDLFVGRPQNIKYEVTNSTSVEGPFADSYADTRCDNSLAEHKIGSIKDDADTVPPGYPG